MRTTVYRFREPVDQHESESRYFLIEDRDTRVLVGSPEFIHWRIPPVFVFAKADLVEVRYDEHGAEVQS